MKADGTMKYSLSEHAQEAIVKRRIAPEWVERALVSPEKKEQDKVDPDLEHRLLPVPEFGGRVLRVVVNVSGAEPRVVTAYFDRGRKRRK